jgi:hypothetical protein
MAFMAIVGESWKKEIIMAKASDKKKAQKKLERRKGYEKQRNTKLNAPTARYRLDLKMADGWRLGVMEFKDLAGVKRHVDGMEEIRKKGTLEIAEGFVVERGSRRIVAHVAPFVPAKAPGMLKEGSGGGMLYDSSAGRVGEGGIDEDKACAWMNRENDLAMLDLVPRVVK